MAENNEKKIENQETPIEVVDEKATKEDKTEKSEWEIQLEKLIHNAYLKGISMGGKTFIGVIYDLILTGRKNRLNTAKILMQIERTCKRMLDVSNSYNEQNKKAETDTDNDTDEQKADDSVTEEIKEGESIEQS